MILFGKVLRDARKSAGYTMKGLASQVDADHSYISRLECGRRMPTRLFLERLSVALPARADELYLAAGFLPPSIQPGTDPGTISLGALMAALRIAGSIEHEIRLMAHEGVYQGRLG